MFLTKSALRKINVLTGTYYIIGLFSLVIFGIFCHLDVEANLLLFIGIFCLVFGILIRPWGKYAEGKGKLLNSGNKLVMHELRPAEFIRLFEEKRDCPDNVVSKPDFEVLQLLVVTYEALGDKELEMGIIEYMCSIAPENRKALAKTLKASILYDTGNIEEAERLYKELLGEKLDFITKSTLDVLTKIDRAMAFGDFTMAEAHCKQLLIQKFPKPTPLNTVSINLILGEICYKTGKTDEAKAYLNYCAQNGGETVYKTKALNMLNSL